MILRLNIKCVLDDVFYVSEEEYTRVANDRAFIQEIFL
jgi:hypothetical protein